MRWVEYLSSRLMFLERGVEIRSVAHMDVIVFIDFKPLLLVIWMYVYMFIYCMVYWVIGLNVCFYVIELIIWIHVNMVSIKSSLRNMVSMLPSILLIIDIMINKCILSMMHASYSLAHLRTRIMHSTTNQSYMHINIYMWSHY